MSLNFPASPNLNDTYSFGGKTWIWNGDYWRLQTSGSINDIPIGNVIPSTGNFTILSVQTGVNSNLIPTSNLVYNLGSPDKRWKDLWLSNSTIHIGDVQISSSGDSLQLPSSLQIGNTIISESEGSLQLPSSLQIGNTIISESEGSLQLPENISATTITATGNITGGNISVLGQMEVTGSVSGARIASTGNITGGNISVLGQVVASGNVVGNFIIGNGSKLTGIEAGVSTGKSIAMAIVFG